MSFQRLLFCEYIIFREYIIFHDYFSFFGKKDLLAYEGYLHRRDREARVFTDSRKRNIYNTGWKETTVAKTCLNSIRSVTRTHKATDLKFDVQRDLYPFIYFSKDGFYSLITSSIRALKVLQVFLMYLSSNAPQTRLTYVFRDTIVM